MRFDRRRRLVGGRVLAVVLAATVVLVAVPAGPLAAAGAADPGAQIEAPDPGEPERGSALPIRTSELVVRTTDGLTLAATLRIPVHGAGSARPGVVLVHGAGQGVRDAYRVEAEAFARAGIATLAYDRRTAGYSLTERSYAQLADDAVAAAALMRRRPGIDPAQVGLWGLSEGGWVAPLAAARDPDTAFLVVVGGNGLAPLRQQIWAEAVKMQASGVRGSLVDAASSGTYRLIDAAGQFPEAHHDPEPTLRRLSVPVLGLWGALDRSTPPVESVAAFQAALDAGGNPHHVLRTFGGAEHRLRTSTDGFDRGTDLAPGYVDLVGSWVHAVAAGNPPPSSVSGTGHQLRPTAEVAPTPWYTSGPAHGVALGVMVIGFLASIAVAIARRWRDGRAGPARPQPPRRGTGPARWAGILAGTGLITVAGTLAYLVALASTRGGTLIDPGPLVSGRPLPWLGLQVLAAATVVGGIVAVTRMILEHHRSSADGGRPARRAAGEWFRLALLAAPVGVFVPWGLYWGLLLP